MPNRFNMSYKNNNSNRWSMMKKRKRLTQTSPSSSFGKNRSANEEQLIEHPSFALLGGNRQDPLNLRPFIDPEPVSHSHTSGNDRLVEILLPPNIYDPLCLDSSSQNRLDYSPMIELNPSQSVQATPCPSRYRARRRQRSQQATEWFRPSFRQW